MWWESDMTSGTEFPVARLQPAVTYMRISVLSQHQSPLHPLRTLPAVRRVLHRSTFLRAVYAKELTPVTRTIAST